MTGSEAGGTRERAFTLMELLVVIVILAAVATLVISNVDHTRDDAEATVARATMQTLREALTGSSAGPGYLADMKYVPGFRSVDLRTHDLLSPASYLFDPVANRGWRGPYLRNAAGVANTNASRAGKFPEGGDRRFAGDKTFLERGFFYNGMKSHYGTTGYPAVADPWGNPIIVQVPPASAFSGSASEAKRFRYARLVSAGPDGVLSTPLNKPLAGMRPNGTAPKRGDDLVLFLNRADTYEEEIEEL